MSQDRKTFNFYDPITDETYVIRAAGIMLYKMGNKRNIKVLIQNRMKYYEDLGGKTSADDLTVYDTAIRELKEETNYYINITKKRLEDAEYIYNPKAKYLLFLVKAVEYEKTCTSDLFDYYENDNQRFRMVIWENIYDLLDFPIHPRLNKNMIRNIIQKLR